MSELGSQDAEIPKRDKPEPPFCWQGNEVYDVFLPIMGPDAFIVYAYFTRREFIDPALKHSVRALADATGLGPNTVARSLEILERLRLLKLQRFGGSRESECRLLDSRVAAKLIGAKYNFKSTSYFVPPEMSRHLKAEISQLKRKQQGKWSQNNAAEVSSDCGKRQFAVSQRNASVSPVIRKRLTRETQTGIHLIREERRIQEGPSPTPSHEREAQKAKDSADECEPEELRRWARIKFTGVMKDMGNHLFDASGPPTPHLVNGTSDWEEFGFNSLAVEAAAWRGGALALTFSASHPQAARRGLEKYHRTFNASLRAWYGCEVEIGW